MRDMIGNPEARTEERCWGLNSGAGERRGRSVHAGGEGGLLEVGPKKKKKTCSNSKIQIHKLMSVRASRAREMAKQSIFTLAGLVKKL